MRFLFSLLASLSFLLNLLNADDTLLETIEHESIDPESSDQESKDLFGTHKPKKDYDTRVTLANLLGLPNGFVNGMVNVVTGDLVEHEVDLIIPASTPLTLERSYCSSFGKHGSLSMGWNLNHDKIVHVHDTHKKNHYEVLLNEGMGAIARFEGHNPIPDTSAICDKSLDQGVTNCGSGEISGRTNPHNTTLHYHASNRGHCLSVLAGSGMRDYFVQTRGGDSCEFHLSRTHLPNGNSFFYSYNKYAELTFCDLYDSNNQLVHTFSIKRKNTGKKHKKIEVVSENQKKVTYSIENIYGQWILTDVKSSDGPPVHYVYDHVDDDFCEYPRIIRKELPDFRYVAVGYWLRKEVCGNKKITVGDRRRHRVKYIKEPVGPTADLIQTYSFRYYPKSYDTLDHNYAGRTDVMDAAGNKTVYRYNADQRLTKLAYFGKEAKAYRTEKFYWGGKSNTNILAHSITDQKGGVQLIHTFTYDGYGNPLKEHIYGNLTGENKRNPMLDAGGKIVDTGCESHVKLCTYGHPAYNLKTSESEGIKKTTFSYYKEKDQVEAKLVYDGNTIKERHFYQYNSQGMVIKEVTDDGSQTQENDGTDIKLRTIHEVSPLKGSLSYLPEEEKYYYTKEDGQKVCVNRLFNHYDGKGRLIVQDHHDADDNLRYCLHWLYDKRGNVTEEVNAAGETTYRKYDAHNNLISEKGSHLPYHKQFAYDYMNRLICEETIDQETSYKITHTYDLRNNRVASTDWYGNVTCFEYDAYNRLVKTIHPPVPKPNGELFHPAETLEYDALGYVTKTCNGNEEATSQLMTIRGQPYFVNYPDGSIERMIYNLDGTLKEKTERNGMRTCYTYDYKDRILSSESFSAAGEPLGSHHYEYSAFHLLKETDAEGCTTSYTYNRQGQLISTLKENTAVHFTYDPLGRKHSVKTYFGYEDNDYTLTVYEYDLHDYIIEERQEDASGTVLRKQTYTYDAAGNQTAKHTYSDAGISITTSTYDCHKQLTSVTDPEGNVTRITYRYDYKDAHHLTVPYSETTDPKGNITIAICNTHHKIALLQVKNSLGQILQHREFFYDGIGQLIETREKVLKLDAFEREVINQWTYNSLGDVTSCIEAVGTPEQKSTFHTFNDLSQKISTLKPDGTLLLFTYDGKGRLSTVLASDQTLSYAYTYDLNDNPILVQDLIHHTENTRSYDQCNRLIEETLGNGLSFKYVYDRQGRVHSVTIPDHSHVVYIYNATDLIEVKRVHISGEVLYSQSYSYDQAGNVIKKELPFNQGSISYTYDLRHQHQSIQSTHFSESKVTYDAIGNLLTQTFTDPLGDLPCRYTYDDLHQLNSETNTTSHTYQHDSLYNRFVKDDQRFDFNSLHQLLGDKLGAYTYDPNGNLTERHEQKYTYDAWDRLLTVTQGHTRFSYTYDDLSRRLSKSKALWDSLTNTWLTQDVQYFLYQGNNEIGSCDAQHQLLEFRTLGQGLGAEIGAAIAFEIKGAVYIPLTNFAGHTQVLLNAHGEPCDIYRYTAFGEETITDAFGTPKTPTTAWRFSSKRYDTETGFIYFGRRYYDPQTARWITADPLGYEAGPNLYAYVNNNPLIRIDLYGLYFEYYPAGRNPPQQISLKGMAHGAIDFVAGTLQGLHMSITHMGAGELSFKDKKRAFKAVQNLHDRQMAALENKVMELFNVDPGDEIYQSSRYYTRLGLEVYSMAAGGYGVVKGAMTLRKLAKASHLNHLMTKPLPIKALGANVIATEAEIVASGGVTEVAKKAGRNRFVPDANATGAHTVFRKDPLNGKVSHYEIFRPQTNPKNPNPWESVKRYDGPQHEHYHFNKVTKERVYAPHMHDPYSPGGIRLAKIWEIPH